MRNGHIKRTTDNDIESLALELIGNNVSTTYITCPADLTKTLGIKLPILVLIVKNMDRYFTFEVQVNFLIILFIDCNGPLGFLTRFLASYLHRSSTIGELNGVSELATFRVQPEWNHSFAQCPCGWKRSGTSCSSTWRTSRNVLTEQTSQKCFVFRYLFNRSLWAEWHNYLLISSPNHWILEIAMKIVCSRNSVIWYLTATRSAWPRILKVQPMAYPRDRELSHSRQSYSARCMFLAVPPKAGKSFVGGERPWLTGCMVVFGLDPLRAVCPNPGE